MTKKNILNGWKQIAEYLEVHVDTAVSWHKKHGLPVTRIGKTVLTTTTKLEKWLEKRY